MNDRQFLRELTRHLLMGAALGMVFAALLLALDAQHLLDAILHSTAPVVALVVFVSGVAMYFAFGAAITGLHFVIMEDKSERRKR